MIIITKIQIFLLNKFNINPKKMEFNWILFQPPTQDDEDLEDNPNIFWATGSLTLNYKKTEVDNNLSKNSLTKTIPSEETSEGTKNKIPRHFNNKHAKSLSISNIYTKDLPSKSLTATVNPPLKKILSNSNSMNDTSTKNEPRITISKNLSTISDPKKAIIKNSFSQPRKSLVTRGEDSSSIEKSNEETKFSIPYLYLKAPKSQICIV